MSLEVPKVLLPRSLKYRCTVIVDYQGNQCGERFYEGEERAFADHVSRCVRQHDGEIHAASLSERMPGFYGSDGNFDIEKEEWARRNAKALIEGTLKLY